MPKFSVIVPLYNKEKDIKKTLDSLLCQTFSDFEAIVINDGSTDASADIVATIKDDRIILFNKKNSGVSSTRNFGVEKANSENIVFLDADDYWYPFHLENLNSILKKIPETKWFATAYDKKYLKGNKKSMHSPILKKGENWIEKVPNYFENSLVDALAWTSAVGIKKDFFKHLNGFDTTITNGAGEDTDLWLRAALVEPLAFSTRISATHNLDGSNRISHTPTKNRIFMDPDKYEKAAKENPFLKKYLDLNRYSFALQYKLAGDAKSFSKYSEKLDLQNLNMKQRFLLKLPSPILKTMVFTKSNLEFLGFHLSSFK